MAEYANPPLWSAAPTNGQVPVYSAASDRLVPTALGTLPAAAIPQVHPTEVVQTSTTPAPAGGTGAAAGAWDTSGHRDTAIAAINACEADIAALIVWADALQALLLTAGILS